MQFDLFVVYAAADRDFVHGYLLPALNLPPAPPSRVQLVDELTPGAPLVVERVGAGSGWSPRRGTLPMGL